MVQVLVHVLALELDVVLAGKWETSLDDRCAELLVWEKELVLGLALLFDPEWV